MNCLIQAIKYDDMGVSRGVRWVFCNPVGAKRGWIGYPVKTEELQICEGTFEEFSAWVSQWSLQNNSTFNLHLRYLDKSLNWLEFLYQYKWFSQILADGRVLYNRADRLTMHNGVTYYLDYAGSVHTSWDAVAECERRKRTMSDTKGRVTGIGRKFLSEQVSFLTFNGWRRWRSTIYWTPPKASTVVVPDCVDAFIVNEDTQGVTELACGKYIDVMSIQNNRDIRALKAPDSCTWFRLRDMPNLEYLILPNSVYMGTVDFESRFDVILDHAPKNLEFIDQSNFGTVHHNCLRIAGVNNIRRLILAIPIQLELDVRNTESIDLLGVNRYLGGWVKSSLVLTNIPNDLLINVTGHCDTLNIKCISTNRKCNVCLVINGWVGRLIVNASKDVSFKCSSGSIGMIDNYSSECDIRDLSGNMLEWRNAGFFSTYEP